MIGVSLSSLAFQNTQELFLTPSNNRAMDTSMLSCNVINLGLFQPEQKETKGERRFASAKHELQLFVYQKLLTNRKSVYKPQRTMQMKFVSENGHLGSILTCFD